MLIALVHACGSDDMAADNPPPFPGMPKPGGTMAGAMDARSRGLMAKQAAISRSLDEQFGPNVSRLRPGC